MAEKRYYWLRLYDDFFTSKRIKKLRSIAGGDTYTIIYLKMQLKALKTGGYLYYDKIMSDFAEELALDLDEKPEDVKITIQYLMSVGLIESSEGGEQYCLTYMQNLIGSESASTQRVRECRARKDLLQCNKNVTQMKQVGNAEKEKEKDIEIDIDKKEIHKEKSANKKFVPPTIEEVREYCLSRNNSIDPEYFVDYYGKAGWFLSKGRKMVDWKAAVRTWERNNFQNGRTRASNSGLNKTAEELDTFYGMAQNWANEGE